MDSSIQDISCGTPSASEGDASHGSRIGRKRTRESSKAEDVLDDQFDINDDGRPKTRRVNPQRLAIRLGPDLVAEMEALIIPGAKMPTFSVRKDFQERYCVDRRHIYDYFHSRGLRVSKEDKHTNLIRGRAMKAAAAAAAAAALPPSAPSFKDIPSGTKQTHLTQDNSVRSTELSKPKIGQPLKPYKKKKIDDSRPRRTFLAPASGDVSREETLSPALERNSSHRSFSSGQASGNLQASEQPTISDTQSTILAPPHDALIPNVVIAKDEAFDYMPLPSAMGSPLSPLLVAGHAGIMDSEYFSLCVDADAPLAEDSSLDKGERADLYNLIQNSLHPGTTGHSTGSYDSYMKDWTLFSGRLATLNSVGSHYRPSRDLSANPFVLDYSSALYSGEISSELFDLRGWISEDLNREEGQSSTQSAAPPSGPGLGSRSVYLGRYDGYLEAGQMNAKEHLHSRGQTRVRTASARGQI